MAGWYKDPRTGYYNYVSKAPPGGILRISVPVGAKYYERTTRKPMIKKAGTGGTAILGSTPRVSAPGRQVLTSKQVSTAAKSYNKAKTAASTPKVSYPGSSGGKSGSGSSYSNAVKTGVNSTANTRAAQAAAAAAGYDTGSYSSSIPDVSPPGVPGPTLKPYTLTDPKKLLEEANLVSSQTYGPILENYLKQFGNIGAAQTAGRQDILTQGARQQADLAELYKRLGISSEAAKAESNKMSEAAIGQLGQQTAQGVAGNTQAGNALMSMLQGSAEKMGVGSTALPGMANIGSDTNYANALLQNTGTSNEAAMKNSQLANQAIYDMLNAGQQGQGAMLQQESRYASDKALREMDRLSMEKLAELQTEQAKTKGEQTARAYELWAANKESDWSKYMDVNSGLFGQQMSGAELAQDWAKFQQSAYLDQAALAAKEAGGGGDAGSQTAYTVATNYLKSVPFGDENQRKEVLHVLDLLQNPITLGPSGVTPFGEFGKDQPATQFNGPAMDKDRKNLYYIRAWNSLGPNGRGYVKSVSDPLWKYMANAIDYLFGQYKG